MKKIVIGVVGFFILASTNAEMRVWTSVKGDTVEAEYVNMFAGKVVLMKPDGSQLKVPIKGLCSADREYLASTIPPEIKIKVDVDKDRDTVSSYSSEYGSYNYERKAETTKCIVTLEKTNPEKCSRNFKAYLYVMGEEVSRSQRKVLSYAEHEFSFKNTDFTEFRSNPVTVEYTKSDYASNRGFKFEGYLVFVEDDKGMIVTLDASQSAYEKNLHKIKLAEQDTEFDDDFDMLNPPKENRNKRNRKNN
jgi:hypothetical protein